MTVLFISIGKVKDWKALQVLNHETLVGCAKQAGATRYRIYRNVNDASEVLVMAELPDYDAAQEIGKVVGGQVSPLLEGHVADERTWESTGWEAIESHPGDTPMPESAFENCS